jgi:Bifunctional DNA primase/polymerase, N-terminal
VLDLDVKKGKNGLAVVPDWAQRSPLISKTGTGGKHVFFQPDERICCTTDVIGPGVDTRGKGGYVIVPPSEGYSWVRRSG